MNLMHAMAKTQITRFSLPIYLAVVFLLSWPFQFAYIFLGESYRPLLLVSMVMVMVGTYVSGRFLFHDNFANAGWKTGTLKNYISVLMFALLIWVAPVLIELIFHLNVLPGKFSISSILQVFAGSFFLTLIPAFGEEFGWRGYLFPKLCERNSLKKALLIHGLITWAWHIPYLLAMSLDMGGILWLTIPMVMIISIVPAVMHAIIFAYFWDRSGSLAVATVYHSAFDEIRDSLQKGVGFGPIVDPWQMAVITLTGGYLLFKGNWKMKTNSDIQS